MRISRKCVFEGASVFRLSARRDLNRPYPDVLKRVRRVRILIPCFYIMMLLAKRLPILLIPEQLVVTSMRNDMIHNRCFYKLTFLLALDTKDVLWSCKEPGSCFLPLTSVATLTRALPITTMHGGMLAAIALSVWHHTWAPRMSTWYRSSAWHWLHTPFCYILGAVKG